MTTKRTKPAADEAACPVALLAREYARTLRALESVDDHQIAGQFVEETTMKGHDLGPSPRQARKLLESRQRAIAAIALQRPATSTLGLAFHLLLIYAEPDHTEAEPDVMGGVRVRMASVDQPRQGVIWAAFRKVVGRLRDPDLATLSDWLGSHALTDPECVDRMLQAVA